MRHGNSLAFSSLVAHPEHLPPSHRVKRTHLTPCVSHNYTAPPLPGSPWKRSQMKAATGTPFRALPGREPPSHRGPPFSSRCDFKSSFASCLFSHRPCTSTSEMLPPGFEPARLHILDSFLAISNRRENLELTMGLMFVDFNWRYLKRSTHSRHNFRWPWIY